MAPLNEVVRTALPQGFGGSSKRRVRATIGLDDARLRELESRAPRRYAIVCHLIEHGPELVTALKHIGGVKSIHSIVNALEREGFVASEEVLPRTGTHTKERDVIDLTLVDRDALQHTIAELPARRAKARGFLEGVLRVHALGHSEADLLDLVKQSGTSTAVCAPFKQSGLLHIVRRTRFHGLKTTGPRNVHCRSRSMQRSSWLLTMLQPLWRKRVPARSSCMASRGAAKPRSI